MIVDIRDIIRNVVNESRLTVNEVEIVPPNIPNSMNFWHGGNLDDYDDIIAQKNGRYEYGAGLYITTHYDTARKYSKGSRRLYLITVQNGADISDTYLPSDKVLEFINSYVIGNLRRSVWSRLQPYIEDGKIKAFIFNNTLLNEKAVKSSNTRFLRSFLVDNGIDYEVVDNAFGWGEKMMVLYNMKKIINVIQVKPNDRITKYDLL
jgi:hypothetical protein